MEKKKRKKKEVSKGELRSSHQIQLTTGWMDPGPSFTLHLYYIRSNTFTAFSQQILGYKLLHALI